MGCMQLKVQQVFLSAFNGDTIYAELERKVRANEPLSDEDAMRFIILPLTAKADKQKLIETTVSLVKEVSDEEKQGFIIAGILSATDKFIDKDYSNKLKGWLQMTKVARLYEEEKIEAINEKLSEAAKLFEKEKIEAINEKVNQQKLESAKTLLDENVDILTIMKSTGLSKAEILKLNENPEETQT